MKRLYEARAYSDAARAGCAWALDGDWPALDGARNVDVAIAGGGYTGLSCALHLAEAGVEALVLEAKSPGWGASGRNGGFCCLGGSKLGPEAVARRFGADEAAAWLDAQRAAIDLVRGRIAAHGIEARTHSEGEVMLAHNARAARRLEAEAAHYRAHGMAADLLSVDTLAERGLSAAGMHGGLHVKEGFALDPGAWVAGLARAAQAAGADIRAQSPVTAIAPAAGGYRLTTPAGIVTARRLVIATNGYSSEDLPPWLAGRTMPLASSVLMTRPLSGAERAAQGWTSDLMAYDSRNLLHYFRLLPDGRFLFGMRGGTRARPADEARIRRAIRRDFEAIFPAWRAVETPHFWSGLVNLSRGLTPYAGPIPGMHNAWTALAYHGNGVAMASYSGAVLAELVRGATPTRPYPAVMRAPPGRFPLGLHRRLILDAGNLWLALADGI